MLYVPDWRLRMEGREDGLQTDVAARSLAINVKHGGRTKCLRF